MFVLIDSHQTIVLFYGENSHLLYRAKKKLWEERKKKSSEDQKSNKDK